MEGEGTTRPREIAVYATAARPGSTASWLPKKHGIEVNYCVGTHIYICASFQVHPYCHQVPHNSYISEISF